MTELSDRRDPAGRRGANLLSLSKMAIEAVRDKSSLVCQLPTRHGDTFDHFFNSVIAQAFVLSVWHEVQGFGMPDCSVSTGEINRNVCAAT